MQSVQRSFALTVKADKNRISHRKVTADIADKWAENRESQGYTVGIADR